MNLPPMALSVLSRVGGALGLTVWLAAAAGAQAPQGPQGPPNALQGFSQNRGQPINIESVSLEVRDKEKVATFIDNVKLVQGDTTLECKVLVVFYDEDLAPSSSTAGRASKPEKPTEKPGGGQQIRRLEARGGVVVTQKDQTATGDSGVFDMKTNTVTLIGNVLISQGLSVVKGDRLSVDLNTNVSRVESKDGGSGRVNALFQPGAAREVAKPGAAAPAAAAKPASAATGSTNQPPKGAARAASSGTDKDKGKEPGAKPLKLN